MKLVCPGAIRSALKARYQVLVVEETNVSDFSGGAILHTLATRKLYYSYRSNAERPKHDQK